MKNSNKTENKMKKNELENVVERFRERERVLLDIFHNFMCNVSTGFKDNDWELIKTAYDTAQSELKENNFKRFSGSPNLEGEKEDVMRRIGKRI